MTAEAGAAVYNFPLKDTLAEIYAARRRSDAITDRIIERREAREDLEHQAQRTSLRDMPPRARRPGDAAQAAEGAADLALISPTQLAGLPVAFQEWLLQNWLPKGVTILYGNGGEGKSLLALCLMVAIATGRKFANLVVEQCNVLGVFCEDDADELHRRLVAVSAAYGVSLSDLAGMRYISRVGQDNLLGTFDRDNRFTLSAFYHQIEAAAISSGTKLVVLDTAADLFAGNENDRGHVRQFLSALNRLALNIGGAVLLLAHPSRSGMSADGDMDGGNTGWSNSVRSRWALTRPKDAPADTPDRVLSLRKSNYSSKGAEIRLRWQAGAFLPPPVGGVADALDIINRDFEAEGVFLDLLDRVTAAGKHLSDSSRAANFAPKVLSKWPGGERFTVPAFTRAMTRLFDTRQIEMQAYGRARDNTRKIVRVPPAGEGAE
jgi:RecA-family ATPase